MVGTENLSRRERQIMDVLYRLETASAKEIMEHIPEAPTYSTVRTILQKLVDKGHISYRESGLKYVYYPLVDHNKASKKALSNVVKTFFQGSPAMAVNSLLGMSKGKITDEELEELSRLVEDTKKKRGQKK